MNILATKRIIVYYMHETEMNEAKSMMPQSEVTESFLLGDIDETAIPQLQQKGLIVQVLDDKPTPETPGREPEISVGVRSKGRRPAPSPAQSDHVSSCRRIC